MEIDFDVLVNNDLTPNKYAILWSISNQKPYYWLSENKEDKVYLNLILESLEEDLWVKLIGEDVKLRSKALKLKLNEKDYSEEIKEVISYLNKKLDKPRGFKWNTPGNASPVRARFSEGYTVEDLKSVVDIMYDKWYYVAGMRGFLRPITLFNATKFQGYLMEVEEEEDKSNINEML